MNKHRLELLRTMITNQGDEVEIWRCANCGCRVLLNDDNIPYTNGNATKSMMTCEEWQVYEVMSK